MTTKQEIAGLHTRRFRGRRAVLIMAVVILLLVVLWGEVISRQ